MARASLEELTALVNRDLRLKLQLYTAYGKYKLTVAGGGRAMTALLPASTIRHILTGMLLVPAARHELKREREIAKRRQARGMSGCGCR